jgi:DNA-directed RNA polymerase subunit alpha
MKNFFLSCKEIYIEPTIPKTFYGAFYLGPFSESYALTVGNALRRTLLSDISGVAITSARIEGALHEYSNLSGVRENVLAILLNLKEIVLKSDSLTSLNKPQYAYLQARGPGSVRAGDLKLPPLIQCVDPDQYIATLSENGKLNLMITIDEGKNFIYEKNPLTFSTAHSFKKFQRNESLGIDAVFTPIKKVNYTIQSIGSESIQEANQIVILEIWTNGSLDPREALSKALNKLRLVFNQIGELKVLQSMLTTYSLKKNLKFRKIFTQLSTDLDLLKFNLYKKKFFKLKTLKTNLHKESIPLLKTTVTECENVFEKNAIQALKIIDLGLPYRLVFLLTNANLTKISDLREFTERELQARIGLTPELMLLLKENLKRYKFDFKT